MSKTLLVDIEDNIILHGRAASDHQFVNVNTRLSSPNYLKQTTSGKPEAVLKIASFSRGSSVKNTMEYIARVNDSKQDDLVLEDETGAQISGKEEIKKVYDQWSQDFKRAKKRTPAQLAAEKKYQANLAEWEKTKQGKKPRAPKGAARDGTHIILHAKTENDPKNTLKVEDAARETLRSMFGDSGYEYVFVAHNDGDNPHVHVVIKNHNRELNKKLRIDQKDIFAIRQKFAKELEARGIEQVATLRKDKIKVMEKIIDGREPLKKKQSWYQNKTKENILSQHVKKIHDIQVGIKKLKLSPEVKQKLQQTLNQLKKDLIKHPDKPHQELMIKSIKDMGKHAKHVVTKLRELTSIKKPIERPAPSTAKNKARKKQLSTALKNHEIEIKKAIKDINKMKIPIKQKTEALKQLKLMSRTINKTRSNDLSR